MSLAYTVFVIALLALAVPNVLGPLLIHRIQKLRARFEFPAQDVDAFLAARDEAFRGIDSELRALGFRGIAASAMVDGLVETAFVVYEHPTDPAWATLARLGSKVKTVTFVEFDQRYGDDSMLGTSNSLEVPVYPRMPVKIATRFPERQRVADLHAAFVQLRGQLRNSAPATAFGGGEPLAVIAQWLAREADALVGLGYCHAPIDIDGKRALTWKGAFLLTWRSVFPGRRLTDWLDRRRSSRLLQQG